MPLPSDAEHEVVARRSPRGLLEHLDVGHAVFGEDTLLLGHEEGRGVSEGDETELGALHFRPRALERTRRRGTCRRRRSTARRRRSTLRKSRRPALAGPADGCVRNGFRPSLDIMCSSRWSLLGARPGGADRENKKPREGRARLSVLRRLCRLIFRISSRPSLAATRLPMHVACQSCSPATASGALCAAQGKRRNDRRAPTGRRRRARAFRAT